MNPMRFLLPIPLLGALLAGVASGQDAAATLRDAEDPSLVAVRMIASDLEPDLADLGARLGVRFVRSSRFGPPDVRLLELEEPLSAVARRSLVARLVAESAIDYATTVHPDAGGLPRIPLPRVLIRFLPAVAEEEQRALLAVFPDLVLDAPLGGIPDGWKLRSLASTGNEVRAQVARLEALPGVDWVQPDRVLTARQDAFFPDDPLFPNCWGLDNTGQSLTDTGGTLLGLPDFDMDAPEAWDVTTGDSSVLVAVLDTGVDLAHPDLNLGPAADFTDSGTGGGPVGFCGDHGTAVAGCVSAIIDNNLGTVGVAPGCRVLSASIAVPQGFPCSSSVTIADSWIVEALFWAESEGARVSNASFGTSGYSPAVSDAYEITRDNGMIHFASSGNDGGILVGYPASDPSVIAVGAVQMDGQLADYSSSTCPGCGSTTGAGLELVAPGRMVQTTDRVGSVGYSGGDYTMAQGTSFASPYAAGVAALVVSRHPSIQPWELELVLEASARDLGPNGYDTSFGYGLVNASKALGLADADLAAIQTGVAFVGPAFPTMPPLFSAVQPAVDYVPAGGMVLVEGASYDEAMTLSKVLVLRAWDADVVIGE